MALKAIFNLEVKLSSLKIDQPEDEMFFREIFSLRFIFNYFVDLLATPREAHKWLVDYNEPVNILCQSVIVVIRLKMLIYATMLKKRSLRSLESPQDFFYEYEIKDIFYLKLFLSSIS